MAVDTSAGHAPTSRAMIWTGRVISALIVLMMGVMGLVMLLFNSAEASKQMAAQGYPPRYTRILLVVEIVCALLYAIPQTAVLGAILLTGYLGGAVATHVRMGEWQFVFAVVAGILVWLGIYLRDARLRALLPLRR